MAMTAHQKTYFVLRGKGYPASVAFYMAETFTLWEDLEEKGLVRLRCEPDDLPYDDSYLETWGLSPEQLKRARKELWERLERDGRLGVHGRVLGRQRLGGCRRPGRGGR